MCCYKIIKRLLYIPGNEVAKFILNFLKDCSVSVQERCLKTVLGDNKRSDWLVSWASLSNGLCFEQMVALDDVQRLLPTSVLL